MRDLRSNFEGISPMDIDYRSLRWANIPIRSKFQNLDSFSCKHVLDRIRFFVKPSRQKLHFD